MTASFRGYVDTVRILIEAKAEVNIQDKVLCSYTCAVQHLNCCIGIRKSVDSLCRDETDAPMT